MYQNQLETYENAYNLLGAEYDLLIMLKKWPYSTQDTAKSAGNLLEYKRPNSTWNHFARVDSYSSCQLF